MKIAIALTSGANVATAGEQGFASLSASRADAARAKIARIKAKIEKTKSAKNYKTSERMKASVKRRTELLKATQAKLKEHAKKEKAKPAAKKEKAKPAAKKTKTIVNKNGKLSKSKKQPAGARTANAKRVRARMEGKTPAKKVVKDPMKRVATLEKRIKKIDDDVLRNGKTMTENMAIRHSSMMGEMKALLKKHSPKLKAPIKVASGGKKLVGTKSENPEVEKLKAKLVSKRADLKAVKGKNPGDARNRDLLKSEISSIQDAIKKAKGKPSTAAPKGAKDHTGRKIRIAIKPKAKPAAKKASPKRRAKLD